MTRRRMAGLGLPEGRSLVNLTLKREIRGGDTGLDVEAAGRALSRAGFYVPIRVFQALPPPARRRAHRSFVNAVKRLQRAEGWPDDGVFGKHELAVLLDAGAFDDRALTLYRQHVVVARPWDEVAFERLLASMRALSASSSGYLLGAGHGVDLASRPAASLWDCSSSTSRVLLDAGLFPEPRAWVSGKYATSYGRPGKGRLFTVWANGEHVFIQLHRSRWWRFDTSPHASGRPSEDPRRGPRLRYFPRFTSGFTPRHWPGL